MVSLESHAYTKTRFTFDAKRQIVWAAFCRYLKSRFAIEGTILDVGCGYGDFINNIGGQSRTAVDLNPEMASYVADGVEFHSTSTAGLTSVCASNSFDFIFSSNLLEHLTRPEIGRFFEDCKTLLKNDGRLALLIPNYRFAFANYFDDYTHLTPISDRSLTDWLSACGYTIEFVHPRFMPFSMKESRIPIKSWLVKLWLHSPIKPGGKQMLVIARKKI